MNANSIRGTEGHAKQKALEILLATQERSGFQVRPGKSSKTSGSAVCAARKRPIRIAMCKKGLSLTPWTCDVLRGGTLPGEALEGWL